MDDYQTYIQSGGDDQGTSGRGSSSGSGGNNNNGNKGCGDIGCSTIGWIIGIIAFLIFYYVAVS